jgi:hypothetical protein
MWQEAAKYYTMKLFIIWNYSPKISRVISRIMIWLKGGGHIARIGENRSAKKILVDKSEGR